jgi:hypothetical protein
MTPTRSSPAPSVNRLPVPPLNTSSARVSKKIGGKNEKNKVIKLYLYLTK